MVKVGACDTSSETGPESSEESASGWRVRERFADRPELAAVVELVEAASVGLDRDALARWFDEHLVARGVMPRPVVVREPGVAPVPLVGSDVGADRVQALVAAASARVTDTLHGLRPPRRDDRFVTAAIFAGRVRRVRVERWNQWTASPSAGDSLTDILLALLAVDVLARRELYDQHWPQAEDGDWPA